MKIKILALITSLLASALVAQEIKLQIVDGVTSMPIQGAKTTVIYDDPYSPTRYDEQKKLTNKIGEVRFKGRGTLGATLRIEKDGYYSFGEVSGGDDFRFTPDDLEGGIEQVISLRPIVGPTSLFAKRSQPLRYWLKGQTSIPAFAEWCGYDFEVGDWVAPHGKGETADLLFRFEREFSGFDKRYRSKSVEDERAFSKKAFAVRGEEWTEEKFRLRAGDWDMKLEIAFPGEKEGLIRVVEDFRPHSGLRMPHKAPESGYNPSYFYEIKTYGDKPRAFRDDVGFFLRTRVVLDEKGEIKSANYAKTHGDFRFDPDGKLSFTYYFNPVVNNRNLEFDAEKNLFPEDTPGTFNFVLP